MRAEELPALEWDGVYTHYRPVFKETFDDTLIGRKVILVATQAEQIIGQIFIQLLSAELQFADGANRGYLYSLRVRPEWRGQQIGTQLIAAAEADLRQRGFSTAVISAAKDNPAALRLYERLGYRIFTQDEGVWYFIDVNGQEQKSDEPCWILEKRLG